MLLTHLVNDFISRSIQPYGINTNPMKNTREHQVRLYFPVYTFLYCKSEILKSDLNRRCKACEKVKLLFQFLKNGFRIFVALYVNKVEVIQHRDKLSQLNISKNFRSRYLNCCPTAIFEF